MIKILDKNIGNYDEKLDCLLPVYLIYPNIKKYKIINDFNYFIPKVLEYFAEVDSYKMIKGDLIVFKFPNGYHFGVHAGNNKFYHCCKNHKLRVTKMNYYSKYIMGVFRWRQ